MVAGMQRSDITKSTQGGFMGIRKLAVLLLVAGVAVASAFASGSSEHGTASKPAAQKPMVLSLGEGAALDNPRTIAAEQMAKYVSEQTNGRITIQVHPAESIGSDKQMAQQVVLGTLDMSINSQGPVASYDPKLNVIGLPFLFANYKQVNAVLNGKVGQEISDQLVKKGFRVLAYWDNGFRDITNNVRPIYKPADLKGLKIRTPDDKITIAIFKALGASPAPLAFGELPMALKQGVFDGQENPLTNIYSAKLYEVQKYLSLTGHKYESCPFIISNKTWAKLSTADQKLLKSAALKYGKIQQQMDIQANNKLLSVLKQKGMKVNKADIAAFRKATKVVYTEFEPVFGKQLVNEVEQVVAAN